MASINWYRIVANGGVSFFTAAIAALGAGLPEEERFKVAVFVAVMQGGLAFMLELKKEAERGGSSGGKTRYVGPEPAPSMAVLL